MGVKRTALEFEGKFTQVPNDWVRDVRLSRRARGLLVELMSHRVGWHVSIGTLQKAGPEGRDAVRTALSELFTYGYLKRSQTQGVSGRFNDIEYELCDPPTGVGLSDSGSTDSGSADVGESDTKNTSTSEHHLAEHEQNSFVRSIEDEFAEWWDVYPRKQAKPAALSAFKAARRTTDLATLIAGAQAYTLLNLGQDKTFLKLPAGWLKDRRWEDEALPSSAPRTVARNECLIHEGYPLPCYRCELKESEGRAF